MISVETAKGASSGLDIITDNPPDCVVADYNMPDMDGLELLAAVREEHPNLPFILYTGQGNETIASQAAAADVTDYLNKDTDPEHYDHLCNLIRTVVENITVESVLQEVISDMTSKYPEAELTVECPSELSVRASIRLRQALEELVENAIEHNDSRIPEVQISAAQNEDTVKIDIADNGPKIPAMEQNVLIKPKERSPLYHGSGLGLWLVKLIVSRSNGQIAFDQNSQAGNIICVKLPKSM